MWWFTVRQYFGQHAVVQGTVEAEEAEGGGEEEEEERREEKGREEKNSGMVTLAYRGMILDSLDFLDWKSKWFTCDVVL